MTPDRVIAPEVVTEYCDTMFPTSKVFAPAKVTRERNRRARLNRRQQIGATAAPPGQRRPIRNGRLPLGHLIRVRKQLRRLREQTRADTAPGSSDKPACRC